MVENKIGEECAVGFGQAVLTLVSIILVIMSGVFYFKYELHVIILMCVVISCTSAFIANPNFNEIKYGLIQGVNKAIGAFFIFLLIGVVIGQFMISGSIATVIYYCLEWIDPNYFLITTFVVASVMSLSTGTSWGTIGTVGIIFVYLSSLIGIPIAITAGAAVSGASFGDKMSPVSDTTNLAAISTGTNLYDHIKSMMYITGPLYIVLVLVYQLLNYSMSGVTTLDPQLVSAQITAIESVFNVGLVPLIPLALLFTLSVMRVSPEPTMLISGIAASLIAVFYQGMDSTLVVNSYWSGGNVDTGMKDLDSLFARGGINSMMWTLSLALLALAMGGVLDKFGFLKAIITPVVSRIKRPATLVSFSILTGSLGIVTMAEGYLAIMLNGILFKNAYKEKEIDSSVLSRSTEEGATLFTALVPWATGGAFISNMLGVSVFDYAPYAFLNWMNPLVSILLAYTGYALFRTNNKKNKAIPNRIYNDRI
ncbi:Na+/H+ antiporter NhaC family protein [Vibrio mediterranei]|uniref:Na+/H+ antiporter NhaC family protein n=1 Tax=Vibrio mediterranei TaxID=689 RepID=UPI00148D0871|nr:Na+/H+ antiporter NhaC family protein [Vibrio mediterranei]